MSEINTFYCHCHYCKHETDNANDVLPRFEEGNGFECVDREACKRRQKRDAILAQKPVHSVDVFSFMTIGGCALILSVIIVAGILFLNGF